MTLYRPLCLGVAVATAALALSSASTEAAPAITDRWLTVVLPQEPPNIDACHSSRTYAGRVIKYTINEPLIQKNAADGSLMPRLATAWEQVEPTLWRIQLREGVSFHDGSPFNAETAKNSLDRNWVKDLSCGDRSKFFGDLDVDIAVAGPYTLEIRTSRPEAILPMRLTGLVMDGPATPKDTILPAGSGPVGTGPYVFDSWTDGQEILFRRNESYWGPAAEVEGVRYIWRAESAVRAAMVELGEADIAYTIGQQDATNPDMDYSYLNSETTFARIDSALPPLDDKRVRLALHHALDLESLRGTLIPETSIRATQMVMPSIPGHNRALDADPHPYDPEKAQALLAEAAQDGVPVDKEILLISRPDQYPGAEEVAEAIASMLRASGFNVESQALEAGRYGEYEQKPFKEDRQPVLLLASHDNNFGDPVFSVFFKYGCGGQTSAFCDPGFDAMVEKVSTLSGKERVAGWQDVFGTLYRDLVADVPLFHMVSFTRISPRIDFKPDVSMSNEIRVGEIKFVPQVAKRAVK